MGTDGMVDLAHTADETESIDLNGAIFDAYCEANDLMTFFFESDAEITAWESRETVNFDLYMEVTAYGAIEEAGSWYAFAEIRCLSTVAEGDELVFITDFTYCPGGLCASNPAVTGFFRTNWAYGTEPVDEPDPVVEEEVESSGGGGAMVIILVVVLLAAAGGAAYFLLM